MAYTYPRRGIKVKGQDSFLQTLVRRAPEKASATHYVGFPLINASGYVGLSASVTAANTLIGFAARDGRNSTSAGDYDSEYYPAVPGLLFYANLLNAANPHNTTLALVQATHMHVETDIDIDTAITEEGGAAAAHVNDATAVASAALVSLESDYTPSNQENAQGAVISDLNVRVLFQVTDAVLATSA